MGMDVVVLKAAKKYVDETLTGVGALKGEKGDPGSDGKSAYEIAVDNGFVGTEAEWLESLKGQPGKDGADGYTPNLTIGTVETLNAGASATASITGDKENPVLNLGIPKGADGQGGSGGSASVIQLNEIPYYVEYGKTYGTDGTLVDIDKTAYIPYEKLIEVSAGKTYAYVGNGGFTPYWFDENKVLIEKAIGETTSDGVLIVAPTDAKYLGATVWQGLVTHLYEVKYVTSLGDKYKGFIIDSMKKEQYRQHNVVIPKFKKPNRGVVTFVVDDCNRTGFATLVQRYIEAGVPLCMSYVGNVGQVIDNADSTFWGKTVVSVDEIINRELENGGEVLCHHAEQMTQEMLEDFDICYEHFVGMKQSMIARGWDVNGIILAGGTGQVVGSPISDMWVRSNFLYSDLYGEAKYKEPYYHYRNNLSNYSGLNDVKTAITNAIENGNWLVLYQHDFTEFSEENLVELLAWFNVQGYVAKTYKEVYDELITYEYADIPSPTLYYTKKEIDAIVANITNTPIEGVELVSIEVSKEKTTYDVAESDTFGTDDVKVIATYSDGTVTDVTSYATIDASTIIPTEPGDYTINISYTYGDITLTDTIAITVTNEGWSDWTTIVWTDGRDSGTIASSDYSATNEKNYKITFTAEYDTTGNTSAVQIGLVVSLAPYSQKYTRWISPNTTGVFEESITVTATKSVSNVSIGYDDFNRKSSTDDGYKIRIKDIVVEEVV